MNERKYDSTVACIAGTVLSVVMRDADYSATPMDIANAVRLARAIVEETIRTEPSKETP